MIYEWLKNKKVVATILKKRQNDNLLIVCGSDLEIYHLNEIADFFITYGYGTSSVDNIKQKILAEYEVEERELENDLIDTVRSLQWKGLIVLKEPGKNNEKIS